MPPSRCNQKMGLPDCSQGLTEFFDVVGEKIAFAISEVDGEEIGRFCGVRSSVSHRVYLVKL